MKSQLSQETKIQLNNKLKIIFNNIIKITNNKAYQPLIYESNKNKNIYSDFQELIKENMQNSNNITYILHILSKEIFFVQSIEDKIKLLNLLPEFYIPFINNFNENIILIYSYLSRVLNVIQNSLLLNIEPKIISLIFGKIILLIFKNEIEYKKIKKYYEIVQGFCFYNMKQNEYKNQICGVLCLKELIINTNYFVENNKCIKNIYEKIILFIDNNNFEPKEILIEFLGNFINKCQQYYKQFVNITFYKWLNYIETNNINLKQKIIDVIGIIISSFPYEFQNIKESLIKFLTILSKDKDNYIRNKSNQILYKFKNIFNLNININSPNTLCDINYSALTSFRKNSSIFNKILRKSWTNKIKNDSNLSKSSRFNSSNKYIKSYNNIFNNNNYKKDNIINNNPNYKHFKKNSARTLNINYYRDNYKMMKEKNNDNNSNNFYKKLDGDQKILMLNLKELKKDINNMSSSLNNHTGQIENKVHNNNLNHY